MADPTIEQLERCRENYQTALDAWSDEIDRRCKFEKRVAELERENAELREALQPFTRRAERDCGMFQYGKEVVALADIERARAALSGHAHSGTPLPEQPTRPIRRRVQDGRGGKGDG